MDDKTRDDLLLAVAELHRADIDDWNGRAYWIAGVRCLLADARAQQSELIEATEQSEC